MIYELLVLMHFLFYQTDSTNSIKRERERDKQTNRQTDEKIERQGDSMPR